MNFKVLGKIASGWIIAPVSAGIITFISLFFIQNVFEQKVINPVPYQISKTVLSKLDSEQINTKSIVDLVNKSFDNKKEFRSELLKRNNYSDSQIYKIFSYALIDSFKVDSNKVNERLSLNYFTSSELNPIKKMHGKTFSHKLDLEKQVFDGSNWSIQNDKLKQKEIEEKKKIIEELFRIKRTQKTN